MNKETFNELVNGFKYEIIGKLTKYGNKLVYNGIKNLQDENKAMKLLIDWMVECDFGLDNIFNEDDINMTKDKFEIQTENMDYNESLIYYAKIYLEQNNQRRR